MAANLQTIYEVRTKYTVDDQRASKGLTKIASAANMAAKSTSGLKRGLATVGALLLGGRVFSAAKGMLIDFNSQIEQQTTSIATQIRLLSPWKKSWKDSLEEATGMFTKYQAVAKKSIGETKDFLEMHREIGAAAMGAGMGMKSLTNVVEKATIVSQVFGERADQVALDIKQMFQGSITNKDRTAQMLIASQGISKEVFNKMSQQKRNDFIVKALNNPAFADAAKQMENSFAGVTSTLKDNLQIALGKVGLPLMKAITAEVKHINKWMDANPDKLRKAAVEIGTALVNGFKMMKSAVELLIKHRDLLLAIGKSFLVMKVAQGGAGLLGAGAMGMGGMAESARQARAKAAISGLLNASGGTGQAAVAMSSGQQMAVFAGKVQMATTAITAMAVVAQAYADTALRHQEKRIEKESEVSRVRLMMDRVGRHQDFLHGKTRLGGNSRALMEYLRDAGAFKKSGELSGKGLGRATGASREVLPGFFATNIFRLMSDTATVQKAQLEELRALPLAMANNITGLFHMNLVQGVIDKINGGFERNMAKRGNVNVKVVQEIYTNDPDRFAHDFTDAMERINTAPTQATSALRGAF